FNTHRREHFFRAAQEGIVFALNYGIKIMREMGMTFSQARAGHANMFLSPIFAETFATVTNTTVDLFNTDGAQGAARGAGLGIGLYKNREEAFVGLHPLKTISPNQKTHKLYQEIYQRWEDKLNSIRSCL
ncbi:MAG: carbohydrate kinase, partial [Pseudomonadota bacterium]